MRLSLGPILYYWQPEAVRRFYQEMADAPVDIVYLGETVCAKRRGLRLEDWLQIGEELAATGKEVVLSTLALLEAESDLSTLRSIIENGRFTVEANDMSAVNMLTGRGPFVSGAHVNVYNEKTLGLLADLGATRWVAPSELDRDTLAAVQAQRPAGMETEVFAFGRLPLAFSARCFTARAYDLPKDDCQFRCLDHPEGMLVRTQEDAAFLTLNGIQTQSAGTQNLIGALPDLQEIGVDVLRLSPQLTGMAQVVQNFRDVLEGRVEPAAGQEALTPLVRSGACNGYWRAQPGMNWVE